MTINLDDLRKTAEAATPGPWEASAEYDTEGRRVYTVSPEGNPEDNVCQLAPDLNGSANVEHIATFDPPTVLELIERAEAAERALDFHSQRDRELKMTLSMISDRLDEHSYDELSSLIEDEPLDQWGETYKSRLEQAEQAVARVSKYHRREEVRDVFGDHQVRCAGCFEWWPCTTARALDGDGRG